MTISRIRRLFGRSEERGAVLLEMAITLPLLLLVSVAIFEFGRAYQTWQVLTNAAREGARMAVLPGSDSDLIEDRVKDYLEAGQLTNYASADVNIDESTIDAGGTEVSTSVVTVDYPFQFIFLNPVARLVVRGSSLGFAALTIRASAEMRNESPF
jgi:Flp pilus assembly protein TadG